MIVCTNIDLTDFGWNTNCCNELICYCTKKKLCELRKCGFFCVLKLC